jgi:hypothetical protein
MKSRVFVCAPFVDTMFSDIVIKKIKTHILIARQYFIPPYIQLILSWEIFGVVIFLNSVNNFFTSWYWLSSMYDHLYIGKSLLTMITDNWSLLLYLMYSRPTAEV